MLQSMRAQTDFIRMTTVAARPTSRSIFQYTGTRRNLVPLVIFVPAIEALITAFETVTVKKLVDDGNCARASPDYHRVTPVTGLACVRTTHRSLRSSGLAAWLLVSQLSWTKASDAECAVLLRELLR